MLPRVAVAVVAMVVLVVVVAIAVVLVAVLMMLVPVLVLAAVLVLAVVVETDATIGPQSPGLGLEIASTHAIAAMVAERATTTTRTTMSRLR